MRFRLTSTASLPKHRALSGRECYLFLLALGQDDRGRDVFKQIDDKIEGRTSGRGHDGRLSEKPL